MNGYNPTRIVKNGQTDRHRNSLGIDNLVCTFKYTRPGFMAAVNGGEGRGSFAMNSERGVMHSPWHQVAKHAGCRTIAGKVMQGVRGGGVMHIVGFVIVAAAIG